MSVRQGQRTNGAPEGLNGLALGAATADGIAAEHALAEGNSYNTNAIQNPLKRNVVVSIKASLSDLALHHKKGVWSPSTESLRSIFQQKKFTSLNGSTEAQGDLSAIVLHDLKVVHSRSSFPIALGTRITGVDDGTFSSTGESFSHIVLPNSECVRERCLQADDVSLAYEFAEKFPGYTATNLHTKGIHEVSQRKFVLIAADHPIVSAISENQEKLQMGEISMMPEGLVKVSQQLYDNIMPVVRSQVESQIKVRDLSRASVSVHPAEYASWNVAREKLVTEQKRPLKTKFNAALEAASTDSAKEEVRLKFEKEQADLEHEIDSQVHSIDLELEVQYNFLSK